MAFKMEQPWAKSILQSVGIILYNLNNYIYNESENGKARIISVRSNK